MRVNGQLEVAQLEQLVGNPTLAPTGRIYLDITTPTASLPKFYDGSQWRTLLFANPVGIISQNSGKDVTVNWASSVNQKVILTDNCVIRFSNPQEGLIHTLTVVQRSTGVVPVPYLFTFDMIDQESGSFSFQPERAIPFLKSRVFQWEYNLGAIGANVVVSVNAFTPTTVPATAVSDITISSDGKGMIYGQTGTPFVATYQMDPYFSVQSESPFGNKNVLTPTATAAAVVGAVYSPSGNTVYFASGTTPFIQGYNTDRYTNLTVLANPGTLPTGAARCINIHGSGEFVGVGHTTTPFMSIYPTSGSVYGTKLTDPVTLPAAQVNALAWSEQGDYLAIGTQTSPFIQVYPFAANVLTGTIGVQAANPTSLPSGGPAANLGKQIAWRPQGDFIAMAMSTTPFLYVVPFNRSTGSYGTPLTVNVLPTGQLLSLAWSKCGTFLMCATGTSPFFMVYDFSALNLSTTLSFSGVGTVANTVTINPTNTTFFVGCATGTLIASYAMPNRQKNYLRIL